MMPKLKMGIAAAAFAAVAALVVIGWARKPAVGTAYIADARSTWGPTTALVQTNTPAGAPRMRMMDGDRQTEPYPESPAVSPCSLPVGYRNATPSYISRYGVRTVRRRVTEEALRADHERPVVRRGRSIGKPVAIVAGSAGVGAAIGALPGCGGAFVYDRLTHNR